MDKFEIDDKDIAMIGIVILAGVAIFFIPEPTTVITGAITALGALATGRKKG